MHTEPNPNANTRWSTVYHTITGVTSPGHVETPAGTNEQSIKAGHEADRFDAKGIIFVPVFVVIVTFAAYLLVTGLFSWIKPGKPFATPTQSPLAAEQNMKPFNERAARISNIDPNAPQKHPRLEGIVVIDTLRDGKNDPVNYRSFEPAEKDNTYYLTPQDLYPAKFVDPVTGERLLDEWKMIAKDQHKARIPVEEVMKLLLKNGSLKATSGPVNAGAKDKPKHSNGGQK